MSPEHYAKFVKVAVVLDIPWTAKRINAAVETCKFCRVLVRAGSVIVLKGYFTYQDLQTLEAAHETPLKLVKIRQISSLL